MILELAAGQHDLITRTQALAAGATDAWLRWAVSDGRLVRVCPGVYAVVGSVSDYQALMAACLAGGTGTAVSHLAAAAIWGAEQVAPGRVEVTAFDYRWARPAGAIAHRSRLPADKAITTYRDLPVVIPPLTVVQVAQAGHPYLVEGIANDLVKNHVTTFPAILEWVDRVSPGRLQPLRRLCRDAIEVGGHDNSPAARALCSTLIRAGLAPFELDYPVTTADGLLFIDIAWPPSKVGLEYNGARDHGTGLAKRNDARRRQRLTALGWRMFDVDRKTAAADVVAWVIAVTKAPGVT